jgi:hypothetical protein
VKARQEVCSLTPKESSGPCSGVKIVTSIATTAPTSRGCRHRVPYTRAEPWSYAPVARKLTWTRHCRYHIPCSSHGQGVCATEVEHRPLQRRPSSAVTLQLTGTVSPISQLLGLALGTIRADYTPTVSSFGSTSVSIAEAYRSSPSAASTDTLFRLLGLVPGSSTPDLSAQDRHIGSTAADTRRWSYQKTIGATLAWPASF